jgi:hypothetical protein
MRKRMLSCGVVLSCLFGFATAALADPPCTGDACGEVSITGNPTGSGVVILNKSATKRIRVSVRWNAGAGCMQPENIDLNPGQSVKRGNAYFCNPFTASHL